MQSERLAPSLLGTPSLETETAHGALRYFPRHLARVWTACRTEQRGVWHAELQKSRQSLVINSDGNIVMDGTEAAERPLAVTKTSTSSSVD